MTTPGTITRRGFGVLASTGLAAAVFGIHAASAATPDEIKQSGTLQRQRRRRPICRSRGV